MSAGTTPKQEPRKAPKPPFDVFRVRDGFSGPKLGQATVIRVTPLKWWFEDSNCSAFGFRASIAPCEGALSEQLAWESYRDAMLAKRDYAQKCLDVAVKALIDLEGR